ncbi:MAG: aldo/keto reductase [Phenylobacterium sp.]|uniref:aldo/keto reductase n=1 Tax=Phenylobacterium sp. TaxID=1871053 RepID=UPI0027334823|nr:aldo/keto reductase [Phenylobacterium sp.]MDP1643699.1 aldo/keto reductase [Phenylobacterium sp.]MDP3116828.1 aldo/keto reductase [Phenylobacterium sp.]
MRYRPLGRTGLTVSEIGFGCASFWGLPRFDEAEAVRLVHRALDLGVTLFDTAPGYSRGEAEPRLGRALKGSDPERLVIATKAGTFHAGGGRTGRDFSPAAITTSVEASLRRLGVERLGLVQLHGPAASEMNGDLFEALERLRQRGLVAAFGANSFDPGVISAIIGSPSLDVVMLDYNVLRPERSVLIDTAAAQGKGVLAGMPLAMGHVDGQIRKLRGVRDLWYAARALKNHRREVALAERFSFLRRLETMSAAQASLAYVLEHPGVSAAVMGTTRLAHLEANVAASGLGLPPDVRAAIRDAQTR